MRRVRQYRFKRSKRLCVGLANFPGVAGVEEFFEIAGTALGDDGLNLLVHDIFIARDIGPRTENADRSRESRSQFPVGEGEGVIRTWVMHIVDQQIGFGDAVAELHDFDVAVRLATDTLVAIFAEDHGLAVLELYDVLAARFALGQREPRAVVEDVAVLEDFDERRAFVCSGGFERVFQMSLKYIEDRKSVV